MNAIRPHIPTYMRDALTLEDLKWVEFSTLDELLSMPLIQNFCDKLSGKEFSHYAKSDDLLMAVYDEGYSWLVIGYLKDPDAVDLPYWEGAKYKGSHD